MSGPDPGMDLTMWGPWAQDLGGALGPGSCGGPVFVSQGEENKLGLIRAKLSHIWPKFDFDEFLTDLDRTWHIIS